MLYYKKRETEILYWKEYRLVFLLTNLLIMFGILLAFLLVFGQKPYFSSFYGNLSMRTLNVLIVGIIVLSAHYIYMRMKDKHRLLSDTETQNEKTVSKRNQTLTAEQMEEYGARVLRLMEEKKLYMHYDLSIDLLVVETHIPRNQLSELFSVYFHSSFYHFIAEYRINHAINLMKKNAKSLSFEGLAYECGFNSRTTFNKYFKEITGLTPSEYRKRL